MNQFNTHLSIEAGKAVHRWKHDGMLNYLQGCGIDIGYRGEVKDAEPITDGAIGVDLDYPEYDGIHLPFSDGELDFVFSSHMFEHVQPMDQCDVIREWFRVVNVGGFIVVTVPHMYLYEKRFMLPSRFNGDHKAYFTPAVLAHLFAIAIEPNTYRIRRLQDCDEGYDYELPPEKHPGGEYQIEMVVQRIIKPAWSIDEKAEL